MDAELRRAVAGSVVVHLVLVGIFALTLWEHPTISASSKPAAPLQARVVDEATALAPQRRREAEAEQKRQAELKRKQAEVEQKRQAELKRKQAEAEKKRQAELKRKEAEAEKKRQAELKRKEAEAEKRRQAELKRKQAEERQRKEQEDKAREAALKQQLAAEEARLAEEARQQRLQRSSRVQSQYVADIQNKVERNWLRPPGSRGNFCRVVINQIPGGEITGIRVTDCDGDVAFQRSVEAAVRKASPLPLPQDPGLFQREIEFVFRP